MFECLLTVGGLSFIGTLFIALTEHVNIGCFFPVLGGLMLAAAVVRIIWAFCNISVACGFWALGIMIVLVVLVALFVHYCGGEGPLDGGLMNI